MARSDELIAKIHELIGAPTSDKAFLVAVEADWIKPDVGPSAGMMAQSLVDGVASAAARGRYAEPGNFTSSGTEVRHALSRQDQIEAAYEALGVTKDMVLALNPLHLFLFRRTTIGDRPKVLSGRVPIADVEIVDGGDPAGLLGIGKRTLDLTLHELPVRVAIDKDEVGAFATTLHQCLARRPNLDDLA